MKGCSASLAIREVQIKTTMRYHFTPIRVAIINKINKQVLARLWRKGNTCTLLVGMQTGVATVDFTELKKPSAQLQKYHQNNKGTQKYGKIYLPDKSLTSKVFNSHDSTPGRQTI